MPNLRSNQILFSSLSLSHSTATMNHHQLWFLHRPRSQIEIKHKRNPDHNPNENHQRTQPSTSVHNTNMQDSKFFPLFLRHRDPMASMIKTSKTSLLICSSLVNIGYKVLSEDEIMRLESLGSSRLHHH